MKKIAKLNKYNNKIFNMNIVQLTYLKSCRSPSSLEPLKSTIDTGAVSDTTMQLVEEQVEGSFQSISDAQKTIDIGHDLSLVLINGMYSKP